MSSPEPTKIDGLCGFFVGFGAGRVVFGLGWFYFRWSILVLWCSSRSRLGLFFKGLFYGGWSSLQGVSRLVCFFAHTQGPGKYEPKQQGARASSSHEEAAPGASASASASGGSPQGEEPARGSNIIRPRRCPGRSARPMLRPSRPTGGSPQGEVPTLDAASLQKLIRENALREEKKRQASATTSEGSTSYAYQSGDTVQQEAVIPEFIANPTIKFNPNQNNPLYPYQNHNNQPKPIIQPIS